MLSVLMRPLANTYLDRSSAPAGSAPAPDPNFPLKTWFIPLGSPAMPPEDADGNVTFNRFPSESEAIANGGQLPTFKIAARMVPVLNLPGFVPYPAYTPAPSGATALFPTGEVIQVPTSWLSSESEARIMAAELESAHNNNPDLVKANGRVSFLVDELKTLNGDVNGAPFQYAATELRRVYLLRFNSLSGPAIYAGALLAAQNIDGVGHPGHWKMDAASNPVWVLDPASSSVAAGAAIPMPVPALRPGESVVYIESMFGPIPAYER